MKSVKSIQFPFPIFTAKEGSWFVAECPVLNIATQGRTIKETKDNMRDLIKEYLKDPDTSKSFLKETSDTSFSYVSVPVSRKLFYGKTKATASI